MTRVEELRADLAHVDGVLRETQGADALRDLGSIQVRIDVAERERREQRQWDDDYARAARAKTRHDELGQVLQILRRIVTERLDKAVAGFEARASEVLPPAERFGLEVFTADGEQTFRVGWRMRRGRGGVLRPIAALYGAQRERFILAFAHACARSRQEPIRAIVRDDKAMDQDNLRIYGECVFKALAAPGGITQVLVTALPAPGHADLERAGWHVRHLAPRSPE